MAWLHKQVKLLDGFFLSHTQKLNNKWSYIIDVQVRCSPHFKFLQNILLRPGFVYEISKKHSVRIGYTYFASWDKSPKSFESENRIFEQYTLELEFGRLTLNNRFRLEQRFIKQTVENVFAQRFGHQAKIA